MNIYYMPAGREMDALIAENMGFEPRISWEVLNEDETASAYTADRKSEADRFLSEYLEKYPNTWLKDYHVGPWKHYKPYSTDTSAAWGVRDIVKTWKFSKRRAFTTHLQECISRREGIDEGFQIRPDQIIIHVEPIDICRAALKALGVNEV